MKVQVQFNCPVGVIVDTETGEVVSVHVWDEHIETDKPTGASRDEHVEPGHPEHADAIAAMKPELRAVHERHPNMGASLFYPLPINHPEVVKACAVIQSDDAEWPAWEFGP